LRLEGIVSGRTLTVDGTTFSASYEMAGDGSLKASFDRGGDASSTTMAKADFASLTRPDAVVAWTRGKSEFLQTDLIEDGKPVRLEVAIFRPSGAGPFPLALINHGSTKRGVTWFATDLADFLNDRGWIVAFPQRRGRGNSDGPDNEGLGADRALSVVDAAITALRRRQDVAPTPVLLGGTSRGGVLSIASAGLHPEQVAGVINFVGGWPARFIRPRAPRTISFMSEVRLTDGQRSGSTVKTTRFIRLLAAGIISQLSRKPAAKASSWSLICRPAKATL
jgi:pimeloyl-ACP methyl ester carboxylesterase